MSALSTIGKLTARQRVLISLAAAALGWFCFPTHDVFPRAVATWNVFTFFELTLAWITISVKNVADVKRHAKDQDIGDSLIFFVVVIAASAGLLGIAFLVHGKSPAHLVLALSTVVLSWLLVHTAFTFRYAHRFYGDSEEGKGKMAGGLDFPGETKADYRDFAYFSFVIGMTFQVSDVQITSRPMRRIALLHGMLAFGFNTLILALTVNTVSGLL